jgi:hypothetical protein
MFNLFYWGLFGSHLDEEWEHEHPEEAVEQKYIEQRWNLQAQLRKYPNARTTIQMLDKENYRTYVRRMLEIGGSRLIKQFDDL